jgi:TctA family transporter
MLTLGVPSNPTMALMIGALIIQGIQPGPQVMTQRPELFWGIVASMWIGNLFLLALNLPMIGLWVRLLAVPYRLLFPAILVFCCIGVFTINNNVFDLFQLVVFAGVGYVLLKFGCEPAPLILGLVLGPMMEEYLRRALLISLGDPTVLITSPISAAFLVAAAALLALIAVPAIRTKREEAMRD